MSDGAMSGDRLFLVKIATDHWIWCLVHQPVVVGSGDRAAVIPKDAVVCDVCNAYVDVENPDVSSCTGWAVCDDSSIIEVVCDECRKKYFPTKPVYENLRQALGERDG